MSSKIGIVIRREYLERVSKKSFIVSTILMPLLMIGLMIAPTLLTTYNTPEEKTIAVVDNSGIIVPSLKNEESIKFIPSTAPIDSLKANSDIDGKLVIGNNILTNNNGASLFTHDASSMMIEQNITKQLEEIIENQRLKNYNIENLDKINNEVNADITLSTYRIDEEKDSTSSST